MTQLDTKPRTAEIAFCLSARKHLYIYIYVYIHNINLELPRSKFRLNKELLIYFCIVFGERRLSILRPMCAVLVWYAILNPKSSSPA